MIVLAINHFGEDERPYATQYNLPRFDVGYAHRCVRAGLGVAEWKSDLARRHVERVANKLNRFVRQAA